MNTQFLGQHPFIDQIIYFVHADCRNNGKKMFCLEQNSPCEHAKTLAACTTVSRRWSNIAIRHLWGRYGTCDQLMELALRPENGSGKGVGNAWTTPLNQQGRIQLYASFFKELVLEGEMDFSSCLPILECGAMSNDRPLFPRLKVLQAKVGWTKTPGAHLILTYLLSASIRSLHLEFYYLPTSSLMRRYLYAIGCKAAQVTELTIQCVPKPWPSGNKTNVPDNEHISGCQWQSLGQLKVLRILAVNPKLVTFDLLDVIGTLPQLTSLIMKPGHAAAPALVLLPHHSDVRPRKGLFRSLKQLEIMTNVNDLSVLLSTYLKSPRATTLNAVVITCRSPKLPEKLALPDEMAKSIRNLTINFTGSPRLNLRALEGLAKCERLDHLSVTHRSFISISEFDTRFLHNWRSLDFLVLATPPKARKLGYGLFELECLEDYSLLDISDLELFAKELPQLRFLIISLLACDTSELEDETHLQPFTSLSALQFACCSFINYKLETFVEHEAAIYITALLPEDGTVNIYSGAFMDVGEDEEWVAFKDSYSEWLTSFNQRLCDYKNVRRSQTSIIKKQIASASVSTSIPDDASLSSLTSNPDD